jgi:hypothetical protein
VDRRDIAGLSPAEFIEQYVIPGKPCILFGEGLIRGPAWKKWSKKVFLSKYGHKKIHVARSDDIGSKLSGDNSQSVEISVEDYVANFYKSDADSKNMYFFRSATKHFPEVLSDTEPSDYFLNASIFNNVRCIECRSVSSMNATCYNIFAVTVVVAVGVAQEKQTTVCMLCSLPSL